MTDKDVSKVVVQLFFIKSSSTRSYFSLFLVFFIKIMNDTFLINRKDCIYAAEGKNLIV